MKGLTWHKHSAPLLRRPWLSFVKKLPQGVTRSAGASNGWAFGLPRSVSGKQSGECLLPFHTKGLPVGLNPYDWSLEALQEERVV